MKNKKKKHKVFSCIRVIKISFSVTFSKEKPQGGYSHIWPNGDVPLWWVAFLQEILNMGRVFCPKNPETWVNFLTELQITWFSGFSPCENPKNLGIFEKEAYFLKENP